MFDQIQTLGVIADFGVCPQCLVHFLKPQNEAVFLLPTNEIVEDNYKNLARALHVVHGSEIYKSHPIISKFLENEKSSQKRLCPCCFGAISNEQIENLAKQVVLVLQSRDVLSCGLDTPICLEVIVPPAMDAVRITSRTVFTRHPDKLFAYPAVDELLGRVLSIRLAEHLNIVSPAAAKVKITLQANVTNQLDFCEAMWSDFKIKKVKRRFGATNTTSGSDLTGTSTEAAETAEPEVARKSIDSLLMHYKSLGSAGFDDLEVRLRNYMAKIPPLAVDDNGSMTSEPCESAESGDKFKFTWKVTSKACPLYLLGRYRKLARDVPQSPWTVSVGHSKGDAENDNENEKDEGVEPTSKQARQDDAAPQEAEGEGGSSNTNHGIQYARKGRYSVEEIINSVVKEHLQAAECRMHPCGREDIDVRCLGNGRPFAMEVLDPRIVTPDPSLLATIQAIINRGEGLNAAKDVELALLTQAERSVWETMQTKAEEKRKGYCCVVWSEKEVTRSMLARLEELSTSGHNIDETGEACIELNQKTPLRVLHRRSLLDRKRYVYRIETALLNKHFFLMRLVTSAGTYVKEFVHGDMGRTTPSVSSIFQGQADIMQLDVTWLYDDFEGNDTCLAGTSSTRTGATEVAVAVTEVRDGVQEAAEKKTVLFQDEVMTSMSWEELRAVKLG